MKEKDQLGFVHRFLASDHNIPDRSMTLLLLHGTGGDENDRNSDSKDDRSCRSINSKSSRQGAREWSSQGFFVDYPKEYLI